jgi:hypothetical protein
MGYLLNGGTMQLGDLVKDTITGFSGVVTCKSEWLNGCVRLTLQPVKMKDGKPVESITFDVEQLVLVKAAKANRGLPSGGDRPNVMRASDPLR